MVKEMGKIVEFDAYLFSDRTSSIGKMINSYLTNGIEMDDKAIHLLFAANRWEAS